MITISAKYMNRIKNKRIQPHFISQSHFFFEFQTTSQWSNEFPLIFFFGQNSCYVGERSFSKRYLEKTYWI